MPKYFVLGFEIAELVVGIFAAKMFKEMQVLDEVVQHFFYPEDVIFWGNTTRAVLDQR